jgi:hypothetical protein
MDDIIERIRQIIDHHGQDDHAGDAAISCACGATRLSDHPRHLAAEIINALQLGPEYVSNVRKEIRFVSAVFDAELTKLEGAEWVPRRSACGTWLSAGLTEARGIRTRASSMALKFRYPLETVSDIPRRQRARNRLYPDQKD